MPARSTNVRRVHAAYDLRLGSSYADPLLGITPASFAALCTVGSIAVAGAPPIAWVCGGGPGGEDLSPPGVYCSFDGFSVNSPCPAQAIYAANVTWVSATGAITFGCAMA